MTNQIYDVLIPDIPYEYVSLPENDIASSDRIATSDEALIDSINTCGIVDLNYMSKTSGLSVEALINDLWGKAIFQDPEVFQEKNKWSADTGWLIAPRYLSGNIQKIYKSCGS